MTVSKSPAAAGDAATAEWLVDTSNAAIVARKHDGICVLHPPMPGEVLTDARALNLAAWLVAMVEDGPESFPRLLRAIMRT